MTKYLLIKGVIGILALTWACHTSSLLAQETSDVTGQLVVTSEPAPSSPSLPPSLARSKKVMVNVDGAPCVLSAYAQCCSLPVEKGQPVTYKIIFDRTMATDFMRIVNNSQHVCDFRMTAEVAVPIRLEPREGRYTLLGGGADHVTLELMSEEPCVLSVYRESLRSYDDGLGTVCPFSPEEFYLKYKPNPPAEQKQ